MPSKQKILGTLAGWLMQLHAYTIKIRVHDPHQVLGTQQPLIFTFWHGAILPTTMSWARVGLRARTLTCLTSASKDGAIIEAAMAVHGIEAVRGSSSRRGAAALISLKKLIAAGSDICITPDGPRGPARVASPGVISLAQLTATAIVPVTLKSNNAKILKTWDQFQIPMPLSTIDITFHEPLYIARDITDTAASLEKLTHALNQ